MNAHTPALMGDPVERLVLSVVDGRVLVDSRDVAARFKRSHKATLTAIDTLTLRRPDLLGHKFMPKQVDTPISNGATRETRAFDMDRDGFTLLAMGFTGERALTWKLNYIAAFNMMEESLRRPAAPALDMDDPQVLRRLLLGKLDEVDAERAARIAAEAKAEAERQGRLVAEEDAAVANQDFLQASRALTVVTTRQEVTSAELARKTDRVEALQPKALAYDAMSASRGSDCVADVAKDLRMRPTRLFERLDEMGWIMRRNRGGATASDTRKGAWVGADLGLRKEYVEHANVTVPTPIGLVTRRQVLITAKGKERLELLLAQGSLALRSSRG